MSATCPCSWLSTELVQTALRSRYGDVRVLDYNVQNATSKGDNHLSNMYRLKVRTYDGNTHSIILKATLDRSSVSTLMKESKIFRKEEIMYGKVLPRLNAMAQDAFPDDYEPFAPISLHLAKYFLLLEDLTPQGFKMLDRHTGLDLVHCLRVMRAMGRFHAASAVLYERDPDAIEEFRDSFFSEAVVENGWEKFSKGMALTLVEELKTWPSEWRKYAEKVRDFADVILERLQDSVRSREGDFNVLTHSDLWINNVMFRDKTRSLRIVDFQWAHFSSLGLDLHYFITSSLSPEVRDKHRDRLFQEYHSSLSHSLRVLGYSKTPVTLEEVHKEYAKRSTYGLVILMVQVAVAKSKPGCGFELEESLETGSNPGRSMYSDNYRDTVKTFLPIFEKFGAFEGLSAMEKSK
ncbi:uncharacterized protein [Periplaneta americana]|uniref:uncharacterized protein n=1 Tax=Periplaneta americana TaxID=6978 RepID=UPI0037E7990C